MKNILNDITIVVGWYDDPEDSNDGYIEVISNAGRKETVLYHKPLSIDELEAFAEGVNVAIKMRKKLLKEDKKDE